MMWKEVACSRKTGLGFSSRNSTVCSSTLTGLPMATAYWFICEVGMAARSTLKTTSSAVKGEPSWNLTPLRSHMRQVSGPVCCQRSASSGTSSRLSPRPTSDSYTWLLTALVRASFWECGSMVCGSPWLAQRRVWA